jgi:hypothetical protein
MADWQAQSRSPIFLMFGAVLFFAAVVWTCIGKARTRFHGWVYRTQEPIVFWLVVAIYYLGGIYFIGYYLHKIK